MINYRYGMLKKLGEGGGGEVFLVDDSLKHGQQLAMKILHRHDPSDTAAGEAFRNEVSTLATLHHPNLVRMFDFGIVRHSDEPRQRGRRFFTMELIEGQNVLQWCGNLRSDQDRVLHLQHVLLQALGVLSYIHRQGIFHFDIKPENLMLVRAGSGDSGLPLLKLTDFGFSAKQESLVDLPLRGTIEYTAPELLRRETFDHRIDLYSLGATLYHVIEGHCPFEGQEAVELIKKALNTQPDFHRTRGEPYSRFIPLVRNLLEKDPDQRSRSAREAVRLFLPGDKHSSIREFEAATKPQFVGREREKEQINSAITLLERGGGGEGDTAIAVTGPEGIGKTALLNEAIRFARTREIPVLEAGDSQSDVPFGAIRLLLSLLKAEVMCRSEEGQRLVERYADVIDGRVGWNGKTTLLSEWMGERGKVIEAQARFIHQSSILFPFIIVADNADQLDAESAAALRIVSRDAQPGRFLLLAAERGDRGIFGTIRRIPLGELDPGNVSAMGASVLFPSVFGEAMGTRLHQLYGGSPSVIVEALRSIETLAPSDSSSNVDLIEGIIRQLPHGIDEFLHGRYKSLDRGKQLTLDMLSCFRSPVRLDVLQAVLPFQSQRIGEYVSSLDAEELVSLQDDGKRCSMRHARLKNVVYSTLTQNRKDVHYFIASTMEGLEGTWSFADLQEVAYQYVEGANSVNGLRWLERAGDEGMQIASYQRAKELYNDAVLIGSNTHADQLNRLRVKRARAMLESGAYREAIDEAVDLLNKDSLEESQRQKLHRIAGLAESKLGEFESSKRHVIQALSRSVSEKERLELHQELVGIDIALGNYGDAERKSLAQLEQGKRLGDQQIVASIYTDLGIATFHQDLFDRSAGYFHEAMGIYSTSKQHSRFADSMMNIGNVMSAKGDILTAIDYWNKAHAVSQEYGTLHQQAQIKNNLGIAHYKLKRYNEAKAFYNDARNIFVRIESKQGTAFILTNLGEVCFAECEYESALTMWEQALSFYREMDDARGILETLLQHAQVQEVIGDLDAASRGLGVAKMLMIEKGLETFNSQLQFHGGSILMAKGDIDGASAVFSEAMMSLQDSTETETKLRLMIRRAECHYHSNTYLEVLRLVQEALQCAEKGSHQQIVGEACLLLGRTAKAMPQSVPGVPLTYLKKGMDAIGKEPISELTWKLAFALGREFHERGQLEKARECFVKARVVLQFIVGQFKSPELKKKYLMMEGKDKVLRALDSLSKM